MKQLRRYMVYMEDEEYLYKIAVPAEDEQSARDYVNGNGEVIMIKELTEENKLRIFSKNVVEALKNYGFSTTQTDLIIRALEITGVTE